MLLDKVSVVALLQTALDGVNALPDATPVVSADPLQVQLDAANAALAEEQKKNSDLQASLDALIAKEALEASEIAKAKADLGA